MKLFDVLEGLEYSCLRGSLDIDVECITDDSRTVCSNSLFFAIIGDNFNGHKFVNSAVQNGAVVIIGREVDNVLDDVKNDITLIKINDQRRAISKIASNFYGDVSKSICMIGVTGTNGKSSICKMLFDALNGINKSTGIIGTIENKWNNTVRKARLTTPQPIELHSILREMADDDVENCVMEVSSHALDLDRVMDIAYDYAVFTNLTEDHLDYHRDFESYFMAKAKLFDQAGKGRLIFGDDEYGTRLYNMNIAKADDVLTWRYGMDKSFEIYATDIKYLNNKTQFCFVCPYGKQLVEVPLLGKIAVYNSLAALGILAMMNGSVDVLKSACSSIRAVDGRMQKVGDFHKRVFVDYAHTPDALKNALDIVRELTNSKLIVVFGCGGNRDALKRPIMGKIASRYADKVFVTSDNPRYEDPQSIIDDIVEGIDDMSFTEVYVDRREAIKKAIAFADEDDVVLIAGKGHETYQEINGLRTDFDDRIIANEVLSEEYRG